MKIAIVVPTIREECIIKFLNEWKAEFEARKDLMIFVVEDNPHKTFDIGSSGEIPPLTPPLITRGEKKMGNPPSLRALRPTGPEANSPLDYKRGEKEINSPSSLCCAVRNSVIRMKNGTRGEVRWGVLNEKIIHFSWEDIENDLGEKAWIIPRRTDCVRSYGYYKAYQAGADILITLDDDCYPAQKTPYLIEAFVKNLERPAGARFFNTLENRITNYSGKLYPRGFPYADRNSKVALCHGLWENVLDFDGKTQLQMPDFAALASKAEASVIPNGAFFTMCGMNAAVVREAIPAFYFLLMGKDKNGNRWGVDRFGDIWCGIFIKKIIDHLNMAAVSGQPVIHHSRASDARKNFELESAGLPVNEWLYKEVAGIALASDSFKGCYRELALKLPSKNGYFDKLKEAMIIWAELF